MIPKWTTKTPQEPGYYWYADIHMRDTGGDPVIAFIDAHPEIGMYSVTIDGEEESRNWFDLQEPHVFGPLEVPPNPFLTEGFSQRSEAGTIWLWDPETRTLNNMHSRYQVDCDQDSLSGWLAHLRDLDWFYGYVEEEFLEMAEEYAPKGWLK